MPRFMEPPGHNVMVKSLSSGQTMVRTSSGWLYAAEQVSAPAGHEIVSQVGNPDAPAIEGVSSMPPAANGLPLMLEMS